MKKNKFKAKIEAGAGGGAYVLFPYDTEKEFGTKARVPVKATFNGLPYSGSLIKYGHLLHSLGIPAFDNLIWPHLDTHIWPHLY